MRIRQIKPSFWTDAKLASLSPAVRLTYIGLWGVADDGGWFRWDVSEVALELYGYESRGKREKAVSDHVTALEGVGRVVIHECGHAHIPRLSAHQHLAGSTKQVRTVEKEHRSCSRTPAGDGGESRDEAPMPETREDPRSPALVRLVKGKGKVSQGQVSQGSARKSANDDGESEFRRRVPPPGALA